MADKKRKPTVNTNMPPNNFKVLANYFDVSIEAVELAFLTGKGLITACKHLREPWQHLDQRARNLRP